MSTKIANVTTAADNSDGSEPACPAGTHFDPNTGTCVADSNGRGRLSETAAAAATAAEAEDDNAV